jgi:hypothetical protein
VRILHALTLLTVLAGGIAGVLIATAQTPPAPAMAQPARADITVDHPLILMAAAQTLPQTATTRLARAARADATANHAMVFYDAHGGPNACGPGCSEWIAAEGEIDDGSANRLQRLLFQLNGARLPIFFNSPGGKVITAMELGRLIRARQLTVSVGHTVPVGCDLGATGEKSCAAKISAGRQIEAELTRDAVCNSACVDAMAGGAVRLIPPWVTLGVHNVDVDPTRQNLLVARVMELREETVQARLRHYIRIMGIDGGLLDKAFAIPHAAMGRLTRDDAVRFGLDRREFGETVWRFLDTPAPAINKDFFVRTSGEGSHYVDGLVNLSCASRPNGQYVLTFGRELLPSDPSASSAQPAVDIGLSKKNVSLSRAQHPTFYLRAAQLSQSVLDGVADDTTMSLPGAEFGRAAGPAGDIALTMHGFSAAYARLQSACAQVATGRHTPLIQSANAALPPL